LLDVALAAGDIVQAKVLLRSAERIQPDYPPLRDAATRILNASAPPVAKPAPVVEAPAPVIEQVPAADPNAVRNRLRASGLASKGTTLLKQGDYANARVQFDQALALDPTNQAANDGLARLKQLGM
jgi:tetratricopeptide (TPR) repeat protein